MLPEWDRNAEFEVNKYTFISDRIRRETTMAVLADLHNCEYGKENCRLFDEVAGISPDAVLIAGDLIEAGPQADGRATMRFLKRLAGAFPVYYGVGNHEKKLFFRDDMLTQRDQLVRGLQAAGVRLIHNKGYELEGIGIIITGLDLPHEYYTRVTHRTITPEVLEELLGVRRNGFYHILIAHDPLHFPEYVPWGADLILSGHVHGGIIRIPGIGGLVSPEYRLFPKYDAGLYRSGRTQMLVSRGLGSHTVNFRLNNRPELLVLKLKPETMV